MFRSLHSIMKKVRFDVFFKVIKKFSIKSSPGDGPYQKDPPRTPATVRELKSKYKKACEFLQQRIGPKNIGDYLEFGVCHGTSLNCMFQTLRELQIDHVRLFGFDSFQGFPAIAAIDIENELQPGDCSSNIESTSNLLTANGIDWSRTFLIKGWFSDTLTNSIITKHNIKKASIIMMDCDLYSSAKEALNFCIPLIKDTSIIFFDDWSRDWLIGERRAFDEFLKENPHFIAEEMDTYKRSNPYGKIFLVTNTRF